MELVRVDICLEVSLISSRLALPCESHLDKLFHIFAYLKWKHRDRIIFYPTYLSTDNDDFLRNYCEKHYGEVKEIIPTNGPSLQGKGFNMIGYVDADLAGNKVKM